MSDRERCRSANRRADLLLIVGFFSILAYPDLVFLRSPETLRERAKAERRQPSPRPPIWRLSEAPADFTREFKAFLEDQFEGRDQLVMLNSLARYKAFGASANSKVIIGKRGMFFYAGEPVMPPRDIGPEAAKYRRVLKLSDWRLRRLRDLLVSRKRWAEEMGAEFLFVIAPDKSTIYPELLPDWLDRLEGPTLTDQLVEYLRATSDVNIVDLRGPLEEAKTRGRPLFWLRDSHWNADGALVGHQAIVRSLTERFPTVRLSGPDDFIRKTPRPVAGDLVNMLHLGSQFWEPISVVKVKSPRANIVPFQYDPTPISSWEEPPIAYEVADPSLPRALVYHDSFMLAMKPFLAENFQSTIFIRDHRIIKRTIEGYRPNVVIHECVERRLYYLADLTDDLLPPADPAPLAERFDPTASASSRR